MERITTNSRIFTYLNRLENQIITANKAGENGMAKACESLVREIFTIIYDKPFQNTNLKISNHPVVDLLALEDKLAVQVTSNKQNLKILDCIEKFLKNDLQKEYDRLIFVILGNKNYHFDILETRYKVIKKRYGTNFEINFRDDIIDLTKLYTIISQDCSAEKVDQILEKMIRYFDEFKGIQSLEPYYKKLKANFFEVVMDDPRRLTLDSIYVEPAFQVLKTCANSYSSNLVDVGGIYDTIKEISIHELLNAKVNSTPAFDDLFNQPDARLLFILGYPGQGKTSLCSKFLFDQLTTPRKKNIFYLKLRNISDTKSLIHNPFNVIANELENHLESDFSKSMLKNSVTILDGLDELYMKDNLTANDIESFCKDLMRELEKYPNWQVIITTRHGYVNFEKLFRETYIAVQLKPLDQERQQIWLEAYQRFYPETWFTPAKLQELYDLKTNEKGPLLELIDQPLLLYIVASLENEIDIASNKAEIYNRLFDQIIERRYSRDGQIDNLKNLTKSDLRNMLQEIAYLIFISGNEYVTTTEILSNDDMEYYLEKIGDSHLSGTLKGILISFYFKERQEDVKQGEPAGIEFFHKSLQEYLTAERIVATMFRSFLIKDQYGQYIIRKPSDFLIKLNEIFGKMPISYEIQSDIKQLLAKRSSEEKSELVKRLLFAIGYLFEKDFIYKVDPEEMNPIHNGMSTFLSFWQFVQSLETETNFMTSSIVQTRYAAYYQFLKSAEGFGSPYHYISKQRFIELDIKEWHLMEEDVINTNFTRCDINEISFFDARVENVFFEATDIYQLDISDCTVKQLKLTDCDISTLRIYKIKGRIIFENCEFRSEVTILNKIKKHSVIFKKCIFHGNIDPKDLQSANLIGCTKRLVDYQSKIPKKLDVPIPDTLS